MKYWFPKCQLCGDSSSYAVFFPYARNLFTNWILRLSVEKKTANSAAVNISGEFSIELHIHANVARHISKPSNKYKQTNKSARIFVSFAPRKLISFRHSINENKKNVGLLADLLISYTDTHRHSAPNRVYACDRKANTNSAELGTRMMERKKRKRRK